MSYSGKNTSHFYTNQMYLSDDDDWEEASAAAAITNNHRASLTLHITNLMGTQFTIHRIDSQLIVKELKRRICYSQGIPIDKQHLLYQSKELQDSVRLCDTALVDGATVQLVLNMRGGPILVRKLNMNACDTNLSILRELRDLLESNSSIQNDTTMSVPVPPGGGGSPSTTSTLSASSSSSKMSVLVVRNGENLSLLRVIENEDGSYSASNDAGKGADTLLSPPLQPPPATAASVPPHFNTTVLDVDGAGHLDAKMAAFNKSLVKLERKTRRIRAQLPPPPLPAYQLVANVTDLIDDLTVYERPSTARTSTDHHHHKNNSNQLKINTKSMICGDDDDDYEEEGEGGRIEAEDDDDDDVEIALKDKHRTRRRSSLPLRTSIYSQNLRASHTKQHYIRILRKVRNSAPALIMDGGGDRGAVQKVATPTSATTVTPANSSTSSSRSRSADKTPPISASSSSQLRCGWCNRRLNVTNQYECRCGRAFCAPHRYAEVHQCNYDYKTAGKQMLLAQNPLVTAEKIQKI